MNSIPKLAALALLAWLGPACTTVVERPNDPLEATEWRSTKSRMYQDLALQCLAAEDHDRARSLLQQAVQFDPRDERTLELLARLAYVGGDHAVAGTAARQLQQVRPDSVAAACTLGALEEAGSRPAAAEAHYRQALAVGKNDPRPGIDLHRLLLSLGRGDEASSLRDDLGRRFPQAVELLLDQAAWLCADGQWQAAALAYDEAMGRAPNDPAAATGFALATVLANHPEQALELGNRLPPRARAENPSLALALASAQLRRGDLVGALREIDLALPTARAAAALRLLRAEILLRMGQVDLAQEEFERVLAGDPQALRAHRGLGRLHLAAGRSHAAVRSFEAALRLQPTDVVLHGLLAAALLAHGERGRARQHAELAAGSAEGRALVDELVRRCPDLLTTRAEERR
ncbi:MAG: tetratricopeptide repeat protein [Planctomycetes bacterium]|nr:tetratricopeptide repeat protein [Planctomycetota bacterium]